MDLGQRLPPPRQSPRGGVPDEDPEDCFLDVHLLLHCNAAGGHRQLRLVRQGGDVPHALVAEHVSRLWLAFTPRLHCRGWRAHVHCAGSKPEGATRILP